MKQNIEEKIEKIISEMTFREKVAMCHANSKFSSTGVERLNIGELKMTDGPHGIKEEYERDDWIPLRREEDKCTYFPVSSMLSASWNKELSYKFGKSLGEEARFRGKDVLLGPAINIMRTPLNGRNYEYMSEDPMLVSKITENVVKGIQRSDVASCVKHFALNNQELARDKVEVEVSDRALNEIYMPGFKAAVDAGALAVMGSYNKYNGEYCCHNKKLLNDKLKKEWGFKGVVMSDWAGAHNAEECLNNGLDLEMGTNAPYDKFYMEHIPENDLSENIINDKVRRILTLMYGINKFSDSRKKGLFNTTEHQKIAYEAAAQGIVLLKNDSDLLPIKNKKNIVVIGENAKEKFAPGGNSSCVQALYEVTMLEGLRNKAQNDVNIEYVEADMGESKTIPIYLLDILETKAGCRGWKKEYYDNMECSGDAIKTQYCDKPLMEDETEKSTVKYTGILEFPQTGIYTFVIEGNQGSKFYIDDNLCADLCDKQMSIKRIKVNKNKGEKIKLTVIVQPQSETQSMKLGWITDNDSGSNNDLHSKVCNADCVIYFGGLNHDYDTEGYDRKDMKLPVGQDELIDMLLNENKNTIIVLMSGNPVEMPWVEKASSIIWMSYAGMEGGNAFGDIVFGNISPSGKLPFTIPKKYEDTPIYRYGEYRDDYCRYKDDIFVGYRGYETDNIKPQFCFGHGLSYSEFEYSDMSAIDNGENITVKLTVKNTGKYDAYEAIQIYVSVINSSIIRPIKELKAFDKLFINCGSSVTLTFNLKKTDLSYYDEKSQAWKFEEGEYAIKAGTSSENILCCENVYIGG